MIHLLVRAAAVVFTFCTLLLSIRAVGSLNRPPALVMLDPGSCVQPCWHDIRLGQTTLEETEAILRADQRFSINGSLGKTLCWMTTPELPWNGCARRWQNIAGSAVEDMALYLPDNAVQLGDLFTLFGTPVNARLCRISGYSSRIVAAQLSFGDNIEVMAYSPQFPLRWQFDPGMSVIQIFYLTADSPRLNSNNSGWRGFIPSAPHACGEE
jgi:hypothetical protein